VVKAELKYTFVTRGRYWFFRRKGVVAPLPGKPGELAFHQAYDTCLKLTTDKQGPSPKSLSALIKAYLKSVEFAALAVRTQDDYIKTLDLIKAELGDQPFALITRKMVKAVRDDYMKTPRKAQKIKVMLSRLYTWGQESDLVPDGTNPAKNIKRLRAPGGDKEITVWSQAEIDLFLAKCPPFLRTAVYLGLYTGQRANDVCRMTWGQYEGAMIRVRQSKTGAFLDIACHPALRTYLDSIFVGQPSDAPILTSPLGHKMTSSFLSHSIAKACHAIPDMPLRSFHGLRYAAGSSMEEAGCTIGEIEAVLGHNTIKMAFKYATQRLRAKSAVERVNAFEQSKKVQTPLKKSADKA